MASRATAFSFLVVLLGFIVTSRAQDQCENQTYCGNVCCVSAQACCATTSNPMEVGDTCCSPDVSNMPATCDSVQCANDLPPENVYDKQVSPNQLRNQCCQYFRKGCCSASENEFLDLLFRPLLVLSVTVLGVLVLFWVSMACCCVCGCLPPANYYMLGVDSH